MSFYLSAHMWTANLSEIRVEKKMEESHNFHFMFLITWLSNYVQEKSSCLNHITLAKMLGTSNFGQVSDPWLCEISWFLTLSEAVAFAGAILQ